MFKNEKKNISRELMHLRMKKLKWNISLLATMSLSKCYKNMSSIDFNIRISEKDKNSILAFENYQEQITK